MLNYIGEDNIVVTELDCLGRNNDDLTKILNLPSMSGIQD